MNPQQAETLQQIINSIYDEIAGVRFVAWVSVGLNIVNIFLWVQKQFGGKK